uniref:protein JINGUBANG-like n=1 Tax=Erigeron canadensis TaxID=72917 RepID=UPI001CB92723|nr:protein JINGUBANG-like [Erigeron canadensis]
MAGNINFLPCSCSFRLFCKFNIDDDDDDQEPNFRSQSFSQESFNSSFSSRSSLPTSISAMIPPSTTLQHHCISTFKPDSSHILSLTISENHLFIGTSTHIHLLPTTNDNKLISIPCNSAVKSFHILNEDILITAHQDHKIRIWRINKLKTVPSGIGSEFKGKARQDIKYSLKIITTLPTLKDRLTKILFAKNYVTIRRHKKLTWVHHIDAVSSLAISKDKSLIYSASWDRSFKVWRVSDFKCLESVSNAHDDAINAIVLSNEDFVYTGSADKKIKVWQYNKMERKHELISSLLHHKSAVNALAYDASSCILISGACSGVMIASERKFSDDDQHMVVIGALLGHKKAILCVKLVKELVCSGSADKTVRLWRRTVGGSYSCLGFLDGHGGPVKCLAFSNDSDSDSDGDGDGRGYMVYSGGLDGDIKVWKVWVPSL